jgi:hypothetical protein
MRDLRKAVCQVYAELRFQGLKVVFSKFAFLRPKSCVLAAASGTWCLCVFCSSECETDA